MGHKFGRLLIIVAIVALVGTSVLLPVLSGSALASSGKDEELGDPVILRVALQDDLKTLNYLSANDIWTWKVIRWVFDGLTYQNASNDEHIEPWAAEWFHHGLNSTWSGQSWGDNDNNTDFLNWTVKLRDGIKWHDWESQTGDDQYVGAHDVIFSLRLAADVGQYELNINCLIARDENGTIIYGRDINSTLPGGIYYGPNGNWTEGINVSTQSTYPDLPVVLVTNDSDDLTLHYRLISRYSYFTEKTLNIPIVPERIWKNHTSDKLTWNDPQGLISFGPFKFGFWDQQSQTSRIDTFRDYFRPEYDPVSGQQKPYIDGILFRVYGTTDAAIMALNADYVDYIAWTIDPGFIDVINDNCNLALVRSSDYSFSYVAFNMRKPEFGYAGYDPDDIPSDATPTYTGDYTDVGKPFRVAFSHIIDKRHIVSNFLRGFGSVGTSVVSPVNSFWYNTNIKIYNYDADEAERILDEQGWNDTDGDGWRELPNRGDNRITMMVPPADYDPIESQSGLLIEQDARAIGLNLTSVPTAYGQICQVINGHYHQFDIYLLDNHINSISESANTPRDLFSSMADGDGKNYVGYHNQSFDRLCMDMDSEMDIDARKTINYGLQESIADDVPYSVLYYRDVLETHNYNFYGWKSMGGTLFNMESLNNIREDTKAPRITDESSEPTTGDPYTFYVNITDKETKVCTSWIEYHILRADGSTLNGSGELNYSSTSDMYFLNISMPSNGVSVLYYIRTIDAASNYNSTSVNRRVYDNDAPVINRVYADPAEQTQNANLIIHCQATDNIGVNSTRLTLEYPDKSTDNISMKHSGGEWIYTHKYTMMGTYNYSVYVTDSAGNPSVTSHGNFTITECQDGDCNPPSIADETAGTPSTGDNFTISANVTDDTGVKAVYLNYSFGGSAYHNSSMVEDNGIWNITLMMPENSTEMRYQIIAKDTKDKWNHTEERHMDVIDNDAPLIQDNSDVAAYTGENFTVNATVNDDIKLSNVSITYWFGKGNRMEIRMNLSEGVATLVIPIPSNSTENLSYSVFAEDASGNNVTMSREVQVQDIISPIVASIGKITGLEGRPVSFNADGSIDNIGITDYIWNISGEPQNTLLYGKEINHTFESSGEYNVTLEVKDAAGNTANTSFLVIINPDTDRDGIGDSEDTDDDNDGMNDTWEVNYGFNPLDPTDASEDSDGDGMTNLQEFLEGTNPTEPDTDGDGIPDGRDPEPLVQASRESSGSSLPLLLAVILIAIVVLLFFLKKRKNSPSEEDSPEQFEEEKTEELEADR